MGNARAARGVCEQDAPPEKKTYGKTTSQSTKSGAGEQFLLQPYEAEAPVNGVSFSQTPVGVT